MPLLDHQHEDDCPEAGADPGPRHGALYPQVVSEGDVFKVANIRDRVLGIVPEAMMLGVEVIIAVILLQFIMVCLVCQKRPTCNSSFKPEYETIIRRDYVSVRLL